MSVRVLGVAVLLKKMQRMEVAATKGADDGAREGAEAIEQEAKTRVPVLTGELRESITHTRGKRHGSWRAGSNSDYANAVEWGYRKRNQQPQPFLFPAFESRRKEVVNSIIAAKVRGAIRGALK